MTNIGYYRKWIDGDPISWSYPLNSNLHSGVLGAFLS